MIHVNDATMTIAKEVEYISKSVTLLSEKLGSLESEVSNSVTSLNEQLQRVANDVAIMESEKMAPIVTVVTAPTARKLDLFGDSPDNVNHILEGWTTRIPQIDQKTPTWQETPFTELKSERQMAEEVATTTASNSTDVLIAYVDDQIEKLSALIGLPKLSENRLVPIIERLDRLETDLAYVESETTGLKTTNNPQTVTISDKTISKAAAIMNLMDGIDSNDIDINVNGSLLVRRRNINGIVVFSLSI